MLLLPWLLPPEEEPVEHHACDKTGQQHMGCHHGVLTECADSCPPSTLYPTTTTTRACSEPEYSLHGLSHGSLDSLHCQWPDAPSSSASPDPGCESDAEAHAAGCTPCLEGPGVGVDQTQALINQILGLADAEPFEPAPSVSLNFLDAASIIQPPLVANGYVDLNMMMAL